MLNQVLGHSMLQTDKAVRFELTGKNHGIATLLDHKIADALACKCPRTHTLLQLWWANTVPPPSRSILRIFSKIASDLQWQLSKMKRYIDLTPISKLDEQSAIAKDVLDF